MRARSEIGELLQSASQWSSHKNVAIGWIIMKAQRFLMSTIGPTKDSGRAGEANHPRIQWVVLAHDGELRALQENQQNEFLNL
jgi:hypothetical protein